MRDLQTVIDNMIDLVPNHEVDFLADLQDLHSSVAYCAPEHRGMWWKRTALTLWEEFGDDIPEPGWQFEVWKVWMGPTWEEYIDE